MKIETTDILKLIDEKCCKNCKSGSNATCKGCNARKIMDLIEDYFKTANNADKEYYGNIAIKDGREMNKIEIDSKRLGCPCYNCLDFDEKLQHCKAIQRDCITYCNWYSDTFKN